MRSHESSLTAVIALALAIPAATQAKDPQSAQPNAWEQILEDGFSYRLQGLGYGFVRGPVTDSELNPQNILGISRYQTTAELRLDLDLEYENVTLGAKPRLDMTWQYWNSGTRDGESDTDSDLFLNEWLLRYRFGDQLFASYGRENLQWGPSFLLSPSNPFIDRNGKNNPWLEMPGLDYAKLSWIPNPTWGAQLIANTEEGRWDPLIPFRKVYAGKFDYTGEGRYASLIVSHREDGPSRLGAFAGWTISDSMLAHAEGSLDDDGEGRILLGGSYTFSDGSTIVAEYYYNGYGCQNSHIRSCLPPLGDVSPDQYLYRRNYGFLQYFNNEFIVRPLELALRGTFDLDDGSALLTAILNYELGDRTELFTVAEWQTGGENDEFGSALRYSVMGGVSVSY